MSARGGRWQLARVIIGVTEPPEFVAACTGADMLRAAGIATVLLRGFEVACLEPNDHHQSVRERIATYPAARELEPVQP